MRPGLVLKRHQRQKSSDHATVSGLHEPRAELLVDDGGGVENAFEQFATRESLADVVQPRSDVSYLLADLMTVSALRTCNRRSNVLMN